LDALTDPLGPRIAVSIYPSPFWSGQLLRAAIIPNFIMIMFVMVMRIVDAIWALPVLKVPLGFIYPSPPVIIELVCRADPIIEGILLVTLFNDLPYGLHFNFAGKGDKIACLYLAVLSRFMPVPNLM